MSLDAVGFDLDYTLAVPSRDRQTLLDEAVEAAGAPQLSRQEYLTAHRENLTERTRKPIFDALLEGRVTDATATDLARAYRERVTDSLVPVAGVESLFADLAPEYRIGLLTNGPVLAQTDKIDALGWDDSFDVVLVTGRLEAGKPHAAAFGALVDELGTEPGRTAYVGDDVDADIGGAAEAGLVPIQVLFEGGPEPDPRAAAHVERDRLRDRLPGVLASLSEPRD
jgi:putative hydrolase of the HAD superfamily